MVDVATHRILIVDDNQDVHDFFRKILLSDNERPDTDAVQPADSATAVATAGSKRCHELDHAYQGEEALQFLLKAQQEYRPFDFAFVNAQLPPGWDLVETVEHFWAVDPDLQIVLCMDHSDPSCSGMVERLAFNNKVLLLKKPLDSSEVRQLVVALTEKQRLSPLAAFKLASLEELMKERTARLQEAQEEAERILSAIASLLIGVDATGVITRWNDSASKLFQIPVDEARGKQFTDLDIQWEEPELLANLVLAEPPERVSRIEATFTDQRGRTRVVGFSAYPIGPKLPRTGTLLLGADLTEKLVIEQQLQQAQKLEAVGQLAAGVAHEINTPMQYLGDNIDFLKSKLTQVTPLLENYEFLLAIAQGSDCSTQLVADLRQKLRKLKLKSFLEQIPEALADSRDGVKHVSRIVKAMKEFSHPGQDTKAPLDINNALESAAAVSTNEWKYVADIEFDLDPSLPRVCAFPGEVSQVFLNIIVNAAHAIGDSNEGGATGKGKITLATQSTDTDVRVSISDTGNGIPADVRPRIFDPFFTTKEVGRGTGQGLSIAYSVVVQKHGGNITCESTPGKGTTFLIELPIDGGSTDAVD